MRKRIRSAKDQPGPSKAKRPNHANRARSAIAAFLPEQHELWSWFGGGVKRGKASGPRGKGLRMHYPGIKRGDEILNIGDNAVFISTGRPDRPFIGKIEQLWQCVMKKTMAVKVAWYYHPEETIGAPEKMPLPGGLFLSPHTDENDVHTISHKCDVLSFDAFKKRAEENPEFLKNVYENNDTYYLAGDYDPAIAQIKVESATDAEIKRLEKLEEQEQEEKEQRLLEEQRKLHALQRAQLEKKKKEKANPYSFDESSN